MKKILFAAVSALFLSVFASCGNGSNGNGVSEDSLNNAECTTVWHNAIMIEGKDGYYIIRDSTVVKFVAKHQVPRLRVLPPDTVWNVYSDGHKESRLVYNDKDEKYVNVPASQENVVSVEWGPCRLEEY